MEDCFFSIGDRNSVQIIQDALSTYDGGELFAESTQSETIVLESSGTGNGFVVKGSGFSERLGFSLRGYNGESVRFTHSNDLSVNSLQDAARFLHVDHGITKAKVLPEENLVNHILYPTDNPVKAMSFQNKIDFLASIHEYIKIQKYIKNVTVSLISNYQDVKIIRDNGLFIHDRRPLITVRIMILLEKNGRVETASSGFGGRNFLQEFTSSSVWKKMADDVVQEGYENLESVPAPTGEIVVVLGNGFPGILFHEAVGHGLEADFNRKKTSVFSSLIGKKVASEDVTVVDDGTIMNRRGSLNFDDEGNPTQHNVLIQNGILRGYMQDRMNASLMNSRPSGNGRRESYAHRVMPRMTNTYMKPGKHSVEDVISSVDDGIYAKTFSGGQVEITSGQFVFSASGARLIKNGKLSSPVKGVTIIGSGAEALKRVSMVANDFSLDTGIGTCGKEGQNVPVGVGQPTIRLDNITVGGTM